MSWIKMRVELSNDPAVMRLVKITGLDRFSVIGRLFSLWAWTDVNSTDGRVQFVDADDLVHVVGSRDFVDALCKISWLKVKKTHVELPGFSKHNGESAKARAQKNQRQARWREKKIVDAPPSTPVDGKTSTRGEERRGDIKTSARTASPVDNLVALNQKPDGNKLPESQNRTRWATTEDGILRQARSVGLSARPGESFAQLTQRVYAALEESRRKQA
jgi:hypothetical protein